MSNTFKNIMNLTNLKSDFTYKEIKRHCILRGMEFTKVIGGSVPNLSNWLVKNAVVQENPELLELFDDWVESQLIKDGKEYLVHPSLRLGYVGNRSEKEEVKPKVKLEIKPKIKKLREKDSSGLYKGTKKSYTFELQRKGKTVQQVIVKVLRKFPEAKEKSIKIWFNRSRKENS